MFIWQQLSVVEGVPPLPPRPPISTANTLMLYRFAGSTTKQGTWATTPTATGPFTFPVDSPFGDQSILFANNARFAAGSSGPLSGTGPYTLGGWFKPTSITGQSVIMQQRAGANTGQFVVYFSGDALVHYDGNNVTIRPISVAGAVQVGVWTHWAVVRTGNVTRMYINGVERAVLTNPSAANLINNNGLSIAYDQRDNNKYFNGNMRDLFVCNRAFTVEEIEYLGKHKLPYPAL